MEILRILQNTLEVADIFNSDWESEFGRTFPVDSSVQVKLPQRFLVTDGLGYQPQGFNRLTTTINLDQIFGIHFEWDSYERLVRMERSEDELRKNYLEPAARQLAQEIDSRAADWARINTNNVFGALATDSTNINPFSSAERRLFEKACPPGLRKLCLSGSAMEIYLRNVLPTQFNPVDELRKAYKTGLLTMAFGCEWYRSNSLQQHTIGTWAGSVTVTGAGQSGSSLIITGTNGDTVKKGDKFSIAAVNQVNPSTRRAAGAAALMQFTALQDYTLTGGSDTISISPAIYGPGSQYQNVDALPGNSAALTLWPGTSSPNGKVGTVNLLLSKWAFAIAGGKMEVPKAVEKGEQTIDPDSGLAIRFVRAWDQRESKMTNRFDGVVGFGNLYPDNGAVAIAGA
jgi:hypothetical protein